MSPDVGISLPDDMALRIDRTVSLADPDKPSSRSERVRQLITYGETLEKMVEEISEGEIKLSNDPRELRFQIRSMLKDGID